MRIFLTAILALHAVGVAADAEGLSAKLNLLAGDVMGRQLRRSAWVPCSPVGQARAARHRKTRVLVGETMRRFLTYARCTGHDTHTCTHTHTHWHTHAHCHGTLVCGRGELGHARTLCFACRSLSTLRVGGTGRAARRSAQVVQILSMTQHPIATRL